MGMNKYKQKTFGELKSVEFYRDIFAEFIGTFFLVSVQCALPLAWDAETNPGDVLQTALGMGFVVMTMAGALGDYGGGHLNPAVSVGMAVIGKCTVPRALFYIAMQCVAGIAGAAVIHAVTPPDKIGGLATTTLHPDMKAWQGCIVEMWITTLLVLTILGATNVKRKGILHMPTILIGFAVACGILCGFSSTGGSMNPARSLGPAVIMDIWEDHWIYWAGPISGGILAAGVFILLDYPGKKRIQIERSVGDLTNVSVVSTNYERSTYALNQTYQ